MLHEYVEVIAWSYKDMPVLDNDIVVHRLPMKEDCPPVKQKVHRMWPDMSEKIKAKVMKKIQCRFPERDIISPMGFKCGPSVEEIL